MGCKASKLDDQPLVAICKKRLILIKASSDHRSALAAAHVSYFRSLHDVGNALLRFIDDEPPKPQLLPSPIIECSYMKSVWNPIPSRVYEEAMPAPIYSYSDCNTEFTWDYINPFEMFDDNGSAILGYDSNTSTLDSREVREREGIPDLEEDTETEVQQHSQQLYVLEDPPVDVKEMTTCSSSVSDVSISLSTDELYLEMDEGLESQGTRDLREAVGEVKDEFDAASDYGKEVCRLLGPGKLPYHSPGDFLRSVLSRILCSISQSLLILQPESRSYDPDIGNDDLLDSSGIVSTLDKLCIWEKKLYKEVKDEEKLRIMYEKKCKKLRLLEDEGAEATKIEATQASIRKLLTKINVSIKSVRVAARWIHQLRDKELQPQIRKLIFSLKRMWRLMLKCHHKQFQAILETKTIQLRPNTDFHQVSSVRNNVELELELLKWCNRFNDWIELQKRYVKSLNTWLLSCLNDEDEETRPVYVMCHDWEQAMERISSVSVSDVQTAMNEFAASLHKLSERQENEVHSQRHIEDQIRSIRGERAKMKNGKDVSLVAYDENGVSEGNDHLKVDLIQIFEALEKFSLEAVKAYDDVRMNADREKV